VRHEGPFEYVRDGKPEQVIGLRTRVMSDRLFSPLSCVESLLPRRRSLGISLGSSFGISFGIRRITKMPQDGVTACQAIGIGSSAKFGRIRGEIACNHVPWTGCYRFLTRQNAGIWSDCRGHDRATQLRSEVGADRVQQNLWHLPISIVNFDRLQGTSAWQRRVKGK
jgi:hypothetical protein